MIREPIDAKSGQNHISPNLQRDLLWSFVLLVAEDSAQQSTMFHSRGGIPDRVVIPAQVGRKPGHQFMLLD